MNYREYVDFGHKIKDQLSKDVNGRISFVIFEKDDCLMIEVINRDFKFISIITEVMYKMANGVTVNDICNDIKNELREKVLNVYFKSEYKKNRERKRDDLSVGSTLDNNWNY